MKPESIERKYGYLSILAFSQFNDWLIYFRTRK